MKHRDGAGQGKGLAAAPSPKTPSRLGEVCLTHNQFAELDKHNSREASRETSECRSSSAEVRGAARGVTPRKTPLSRK
jgi:hypothetical protein